MSLYLGSDIPAQLHPRQRLSSARCSSLMLPVDQDHHTHWPDVRERHIHTRAPPLMPIYGFSTSTPFPPTRLFPVWSGMAKHGRVKAQERIYGVPCIYRVRVAPPRTLATSRFCRPGRVAEHIPCGNMSGRLQALQPQVTPKSTLHTVREFP